MFFPVFPALMADLAAGQRGLLFITMHIHLLNSLCVPHFSMCPLLMPMFPTPVRDHRATLTGVILYLTRLFVLFKFFRLSNNLVYYGLSFFSEDLGRDPYFSFFLAGAVEVPALILCQLLLGRIGRKWLIFTFMTVGGVSLLCVMAIPTGSYCFLFSQHTLLVKFL